MIHSAAICKVCDRGLGRPIYRSASGRALSSLCELHQDANEVYLCLACGHLQSSELPNLERYYDEQYRILDANEEEDQLYAIVDGRQVFRAEHQARTFLRQVDRANLSAAAERLPQRSRVLDFGCAKGATSRQLRLLRPDIELRLFDVSDRYTSFWSRFADERSWATHDLPSDWRHSFDAVISFFVLEHVSDLAATLGVIHDLLKPGGLFHAVVPNTYANPADFIVVDHVHHFSATSLQTALARGGFSVVDIDASIHDSAWVVTAQREDGAVEFTPPASEVASINREARSIAGYWSQIETQVREFEQRHGSPRAAVYGAGFYGSLIASMLARPEQIVCFADRNPHLQGRRRWHAPIVSPDEVDPTIRHMYVGLNPRTARQSIAGVDAFRNRRQEYFFLGFPVSP